MSDQRLPPVLLLHGVCSTGPTLAVLAHAFRRQGCEVAAPTLAAAQRTDTGASDGSLAGLTLSRLRDEARAHAGRLARHFGTRPIIVGHSNGALLALALAGLGEASAVGLIAPAPPPSVPGAPMWLRRLPSLFAPAAPIAQLRHLEGWGGGLYGGPIVLIPWARGNGHERFISPVVAARGRVQLDLASCCVGRLSLTLDLT